MQIVEQAINESIAKNRIAHIDAVDCRQAQCSVRAVCDELFAECEDYVGANDNGGTAEYWGTNVEGQEWRVHVEVP